MKKAFIIGLSILTLAGCQSTQEADNMYMTEPLPPCNCQTTQAYTENVVCDTVQTVRKSQNSYIQYRICTKKLVPTQPVQIQQVQQPMIIQQPVQPMPQPIIVQAEPVQPHPCTQVIYDN